MINNIQWLGHGSFLIDGAPPSIYVNPWRVGRPSRPADIILIGDHHYESCSPGDIARLRGEHTQIIATERAAREIGECTILRPWQSLTIGRTCVKAIPAYQPGRGSATTADALGFVISVHFYDIYYAGSSGLTDEMKALKPDVAILPINSDSGMTAEEAAQAISLMQPRWAIPSHWNPASNRLEASRFERMVNSLAPSVQVMLPQHDR